MADELILEGEETIVESFDDVVYMNPEPVEPNIDPAIAAKGTISATDEPDDEIKKEHNPFVLGTIKGIFMEFGKLNGNGRIYLPEIADAVLNDNYIRQMMAAKCLLGECHHPGDQRGSIWIDEACISITKLWKEGNFLMGEADILDTPKGRIVWTLVKYGSKLGVSARAGGKGVKGTYQGVRADIIKPQNYSLKTFDVVLNPGFAIARPNFVAEEGGSNEELNMQTLAEEVKSLIESDGCNKEFLRSYINYCEDDGLKSLLPMLEETTTVVNDNTLINEQMKELRDENEELRETINLLNGTINSLREEATKQVSVEDAPIEELLSLLEEKNGAIRDLELLAESEVLPTNTLQLYDELQFTYAELKAKYEELQASDNKCKETMSDMQDIISTITEENDALKAQVESLIHENSELKTQVVEETEDEGFPIDFLEEVITEEAEESVTSRHIPKINKTINLSGSFINCIVNEESSSSTIADSNRRTLISSLGGN